MAEPTTWSAMSMASAAAETSGAVGARSHGERDYWAVTGAHLFGLGHRSPSPRTGSPLRSHRPRCRPRCRPCRGCACSAGRVQVSSRRSRWPRSNSVHAIAGEGHELVYGGGHVGLMGIVADAVLAGGGSVTGVITEHLVGAEVAHHGLSELEVTSSMHERKARMAALSDGVIVLPGGFGTFEEAFEMLTWNQLGLAAVPGRVPRRRRLLRAAVRVHRRCPVRASSRPTTVGSPNAPPPPTRRSAWPPPLPPRSRPNG